MPNVVPTFPGQLYTHTTFAVPTPQMPQSPPNPMEMEVISTADGPMKVRRKKKPYTQNSLESVQNIFQVDNPFVVSLSNITQFLSHHPHLVPREPYPMAAPKVLIGIEVEAENVLKIDPNIPLVFWQIKNDGSLRNHGMEFVTPGVIAAAHAESAVKQLFDGLNSDVDFSPRTSIHVHMDVRQLTMEQVVGLLLTYTAVENLMFKYAGLNRRTNIFCVPITETGLFDHLSANPTKFIYSIEQHWSKYTAMNLMPIGQLGSIEFRHMPGTNNLRQVLGWIDLVTRLKLYAYKSTLPAIVSRISELNGNSRYKQFVEEVFGEASLFLDMSALANDMEKPVYIVKNSVISNKFHEAVVSKAVPESQLGALLANWMIALSEEQIAALKELCKGWGNTNLESVFRDMISRPTNYLNSYSKDERLMGLIHQVLKMKTAKKPKKLSYTDIQEMTSQELHDGIHNGDLTF